MHSPALSVLIVNYNSGADLRRCLAALAAQTRRDFEIVLVDNGSTDGSLERVLEDCPFSLGDAAPLPALRLVEAGRNLGFAAANNRAAALARAPLLALLNPDAFAEPGWLAALAAVAIRHPEIAMFGSTQLLDAEPARLDGAGDVYHASGLVWRGAGTARPQDLPAEAEAFAPCAAAALYRREVFLAAGGFDERFFCYCEDIDLGFRLRLAGHRALQLGNAVVRHKGSAASGRYSAFACYHGARNRLWTFVKCMPWPLLVLLWPAHLVVTAAMLAAAGRRGTLRATLCGLYDGLAGLGPLLADRRTVHANRVSCWKIARALTWSPLALLTRRPSRRPLPGPDDAARMRRV
ncbi:MAG: glycosyltransferase [Gammaproteobacteria bacterium]|jgi:GT2 family glycosyltransferase|nr:glycosyltransferase [Gammaproteobacteria bacterium]